jgi:hypothetical protein
MLLIIMSVLNSVIALPITESDCASHTKYRKRGRSLGIPNVCSSEATGHREARDLLPIFSAIPI